MLTLIREVFQRVDEKTQKYLSISLVYVALLHVVVELKLFMEPSSLAGVENPAIISRGLGWSHKDNIPQPKPISVDEFPSNDQAIADKEV